MANCPAPQAEWALTLLQMRWLLFHGQLVSQGSLGRGAYSTCLTGPWVALMRIHKILHHTQMQIHDQVNLPHGTRRYTHKHTHTRACTWAVEQTNPIPPVSRSPGPPVYWPWSPQSTGCLSRPTGDAQHSDEPQPRSSNTCERRAAVKTTTVRPCQRITANNASFLRIKEQGPADWDRP